MTTETYRDPEGGGSLIVAWQAKEKNILIVGGGIVAAGRVFNALEADAHVIVVAPNLCPELQYRATKGQITWHPREFAATDLENADMVLTAIDDNTESRKIALMCREKRIPVNAADINHLCDFWFMSTHRDHSVQIAVSTNSKAPRLANRIRRQVASALPRGTGKAVDQIGRLRKRIREADPKPENSKRRMTWLTQLCDYWPIEQLAKLDSDNIDSLLEAYIENHDPKGVKLSLSSASTPASSIALSPKMPPTTYPDNAGASDSPATTIGGSDGSSSSPNGKLTLVGAGLGDPELLTIKAKRALDEADIVLADKLIPEPVLALIDCEIYTARKFPGAAHQAQEDLYKRGLEELAKGKNVVRLKQGDPFVYGRGGEEVLFFRKYGYEPQVIPGLTSAVSGPGLCGIPVTHRGVADQVLVLSGSNKEGELPNIPEFISTRTLVILMSVKRLSSIVDLLIKTGYPDSLPLAIVERAGCNDQRTARGTIGTIGAIVERVGHNPPGLIVTGHVVNVLSNAELEDRYLDSSTLGYYGDESTLSVAAGTSKIEPINSY